MNILEKIIQTKIGEIAENRKIMPEISELSHEVYRPVISFKEALLRSDSGIIAEFKRKSPSKGFIKAEAKVEEIVPGYERAGAAAISVLTDRQYFGGSVDDLVEARKDVNIPLLRKDFIIDTYQIDEARYYGADVILLIAAALKPEKVKELAEYAHSLGLEVLLEIHDQSELGHICESIDVVGVNNRDLTTFITDIKTSVELSRMIPPEFVKISESGISTPLTVKELRIYGFKGFLMGENFMKQSDPAHGLTEFLGHL
ncbi:MAG: indole-3-glycerol phosphate synthase TrpC [Rikenellaceae bacterium]|nr:indole-3-glycerol phosphate synthase TrpC [Rikenellaceae bacterium]